MNHAPELFADAPPLRPGCGVVVTIPAKDEAATIARTLAALAAQRAPNGTPLEPASFEVLLFANNCRDATAEIACAFAARARIAVDVAQAWLSAEHAHVGTARRALMDAAVRRFAAAGREGLILTTDADSIVTPRWIANTCAEMTGVDAVTGRIVLDPAYVASLSPAGRRMLAAEGVYQFAVSELTALIDPRTHDPWPRHWQHFGASFAVRSDVYRAAGGLPAVRFFEDIAFYEVLERRAARVRHSLRVRVTTSGRHTARVSGGLASYLGNLDALAQHGRPLLVEHPASTFERLTGREPALRVRVPLEAAIAGLRDQIARVRSSAACATRSSAASGAG
jgi:glycosyltransferase involved in cell wall biosynthesis